MDGVPQPRGFRRRGAIQTQPLDPERRHAQPAEFPSLRGRPVPPTPSLHCRSLAVVSPGTSGQTTAGKRAPMLGKWPNPNRLSEMFAWAGGLWIRRVLVPPSGLRSSPGGATGKPCKPIGLRGFLSPMLSWRPCVPPFCRRFSPVRAEFLAHQLVRALHHRNHRGFICVLVASVEGGPVRPISRRHHVGVRIRLSLRGPLSPVCVPQGPVQLR